MVVLLLLVVLSLAFGVGTVIEGVLWMFLITAVLAAMTLWWGWRTVTASRH